jgi:hypothetical protein
VEVEAAVAAQVGVALLLHHQEAAIVVLAVVQEAIPVAPQAPVIHTPIVQAEPT